MQARNRHALPGSTKPPFSAPQAAHVVVPVTLSDCRVRLVGGTLVTVASPRSLRPLVTWMAYALVPVLLQRLRGKSQL